MKIPYKKLIVELHRDYYARTDFDIDDQDISILLLVLLYHNKKITTQQLCCYFKKYNELDDKSNKMLSRRINTYHSKINDKWYSEEYFDEILTQVVYDTCKIEDMTIDDFLKILNIGFSRKRNWCVDYTVMSIIKPIISYYNIDRSFDVLKDFDFKYDIEYTSYEEADKRYQLGSGYCCEDCDGCFSQYKYNEYLSRYKKYDNDEIKKNILPELMKLKTHNKNPDNKLIWNF